MKIMKKKYTYAEVPMTDIVVIIKTEDVGGRNWTWLTLTHKPTGLKGGTFCREKASFNYVDMMDTAMGDLLRNLNDPVHTLVYTYDLVNPDGFNTVEVHAIMEEAMSKAKDFNKEKFWNALRCNTCGDAGIYHCDIVTAIRCGLEDRDMTIAEWD